MVCKRNITGFSSLFICTECKSLYCKKCAQALSVLENMCWACDAQIDESKPMKPFKSEEEMELEISEEPQKKPRTEK